MIRPTLRAVLFFSAGIPITFIIIILEPELWTICASFSLLVLLAILLDGVMALPPHALKAEFDVPDKIFIGEEGQLTATIPSARFLRPTDIELLLEQRGDAEPSVLTKLKLTPMTKAEASFRLVPHRRGRIWIDKLWARWQGPFRLAEFVRTVDVTRMVDVVPNIRGVQRAELQFLANDAIFGEKVQQKGEGTEFEALREYIPGMDIRYMDWKHSARHRKLVSREFRTERNHHVVLAFDTGHLMLEPVGGIPRLDHAINAALRLAWISLRGGDLVATYGFDARVRHYQQPLRGTQNFSQIQRATAELQYHTQETNFTLGLAELHARLKRRALVIVFTDFIDTVTAELLIDSMQRIANRHLVVFVTMRDSYLQQTVDMPPNRFEDVARAVIAQDFLHDRSIVLERLARIGVQCLDVPSNNLPVGLINRYVQIKQRGLI